MDNFVYNSSCNTKQVDTPFKNRSYVYTNERYQYWFVSQR